MKPTLNNCLPDIQEEIDFLQEIARSISKKYKREIILSWEDGLEGVDFNNAPIFMVKQDSPFQIVQNNTPITANFFVKDEEFKKKLKTNIKNHVPEKLYNFIVMKTALQNTGLYQLLLESSGYEALETYMESMYHKENIRKFFVKIYPDGKIQLYS